MQSKHILTQRTSKLEKIQQFGPLAQAVQDPPSALLTAKQLQDLRGEENYWVPGLVLGPVFVFSCYSPQLPMSYYLPFSEVKKICLSDFSEVKSFKSQNSY